MERTACLIGVFFVVILLFTPLLAFSQDLEINNFMLISKELVSRFEYDYTYKADIIDTFTIRQNRRYAFSWANPIWEIQHEQPRLTGEVDLHSNIDSQQVEVKAPGGIDFYRSSQRTSPV